MSILDNLENVGQVRTLKIENLRKIGEYEKALEILSEVRDGNQITDGERFEGIRLAWDIGDMNLVKSFSDEVLEQNPFSKVASTFYIRSLIKMRTIEELRASSERILVEFTQPY